MRKLLTLVAAAALLWPASGAAFDLDATPTTGNITAEGGIVTGQSRSSGDIASMAFGLCLDRDGADTTCGEFDFDTDAAGSPSWVRVEIVNGTAECTGDLTIRHYHLAGDAAGDKISDTTLTVGGTEAVRIEGPLPRFIDVDMTNIATCAADELDVLLVTYYKKR